MPDTSPITSPILGHLLIAATIAAVLCPSGVSARCHGQVGEWTLDELREVTSLLKQLRNNSEQNRDTLGTLAGSIDWRECQGWSHDEAVYEAIRDRGIELLKQKFKEHDDAQATAKPR